MPRGNKTANTRKRTALPDTSRRSKDPGLPSFTKKRNATNEPIAPLPGQVSSKGKGKANGKVSPALAPLSTEQDEAMALDPSLSESIAALNKSLAATQDDDLWTSEADKEASDGFIRVKQMDATIAGKRDSSLKAYMRELRKVLDLADVLLEVLDARDPLGCRSLETERAAMRAGKRVVLILNKIDLVPRSNVEAWLKYLRHDFPTLAFKSSTQQQRANLSQGASSFYRSQGSGSATSATTGEKGAALGVGAEALGAGALLQLIKNYSRSLNLKTSVSVGVFGPPNVGKSSVINSLLRARVCSVAATPGHTKVVQGVMLDRSVRLLDCPGIVFADEEGGKEKREAALLRNVVKVELVEDPISPVEAILARVEQSELCTLYGISEFKAGDAQDFLLRVALHKGRLGRGGVPDLDGTARTILHDWNVGKISYYTNPPAVHPSAVPSANSAASTATGGDSLTTGASMMSSFGEAFDLAALLGAADADALGGGANAGKGAMLDLSTRPTRVPPRTPASAGPQEMQTEDVDVTPTAAAKASGTTPGGVSSSAGSKRKRGLSISSVSDVSSLAADSDAEDDEDASALLARGKITASKDDELPEWMQRQAARASSQRQQRSAQSDRPAKGNGNKHGELSSMFSESELAHLAPSRGGARKKARKERKRAEKAGAGLVDVLENSMVLAGFEEEDDDVEIDEGDDDDGRGAKGMFAVAAQVPAHSVSKGSEKAADVPLAIEEEEEEL